MNATGPASAPVRVLLVCESLAVTGGVERFVCQLGNELASRGMNVAIGNLDASRGRVAYAVDAAVRILCSDDPDALRARSPSRLGRKVALLLAQWRVGGALGRLALAERPDVLVLNGVVTACAVLARHPSLRRRAICCDHNHFGARSRVWQRLRAWFYPQVAAVVSLTDADRGRFAALNADTRVIANASVLHADAPADIEAPIVLAVGRLQAQKGFDLLLRSWASVIARRPQARLRIVGDGPLADELQQLAKSLDVAGSVEWLAPTRDIEAFYRQAALFVLSSRYEGMPMALLEAQALGVPAVAFDCPTGPREIISAETGIVVAHEDTAALAGAIDELLGDAPRRHRMGVAAIARGRSHFSLQAHFDAWARLIDDVAHRLGAAPVTA